MPTETPTKPVAENTISRVNNELDLGSDMEFQKRWWRFERAIWIVFTIIILLDMSGAFGHGFLAKGHMRTSDGTMDITYDRIQRFSAPSVLTIKFTPAAIHDGKAQVWVNDAIVTELGNQRVVPDPVSTTLDHEGMLFTFDSKTIPDTIQFALQPKKPGLFDMALRGPGSELMTAKILVFP